MKKLKEIMMYVIWAALTFASIQVKRNEHRLMISFSCFFLIKQLGGLSRCFFPKDSKMDCGGIMKLIKQLIN